MKEWIPISEEKPEDFEETLVTWVNHNPVSYYANIKDVPFVSPAIYLGGNWYWWSETRKELLEEYGPERNAIAELDVDIEVTAWMRLPKAYGGTK